MLPMENGYVGDPKFKRRKVSAVRDFPPGCAPALKCMLIPEKEGTGAHSDGNLVFEDKSEILAEPNCTNNTNVMVDSHQTDIVSFASGGVVKKIPTKNYPPRRRVSAARDFPPGCGRSTLSLDKEQFQEVCGSPKKQHPSQDKTDAVEQLLKDAKNDDLKKTGLVVSDGNSYENSIKMGMKQSRGTAQEGNAKEDNIIAPDVENLCRDQDVNHYFENKLDQHVQSDLKQSGGVNLRNKNEDDICQVKHKTEYDENLMMEVVGRDALPVTSGINKLQLDTSERSRESMEKHDQYQLDSMSSSVDLKDTTDDRTIMEHLGKEIVVYKEKNHSITLPSDSTGIQEGEQEEDVNFLDLESTRVVVHGLMSPLNCPWKKKRASMRNNQAVRAGEKKERNSNSSQRKKEKLVSSSGTQKKGHCGRELENKSPSFSKDTPKQEAGPLVVSNKDDAIENNGECEVFLVASREHVSRVSLPPFGLNNSSGRINENDATVTRQKVRETLRLFQAVCRKLQQEEEAKSKEGGNSLKRIDLQAGKILKEKGKSLHTSKKVFGAVPGVEVGDEFHYRVELHIIGIHAPIQAGIDYIKHEGKVVATSIVASGGYEDNLDNSESLIYTGSGGTATKGKEPEDQKLDRGNLALKNSIDAKYPVRVIRGFKDTKSSESSDVRTKALYTYTYDGLYTVERYWQEPGPLGKLVFKFQLERIPGQPELAWRELKNSKKNKIREGLCLADISQGKEKIPICAVNTVDKEKPPLFTYVTRMIYPDWLRPIPPRGCCDCSRGCIDSNCVCAVKNGGEIPYNYDGAIVEAKPLVYECGPTCKCPRSCRNRVSQNGIRVQLEIFKTEKRGWGVRSLNSIPSGSFVCEYVGELLEDKEAEERTGNDEYLFDIGSHFNDNGLWDGLSSLIPDAHSSASETVDDSGFTIDAAQFGNVGRFINHSCSPNLYAQNVLYDHEDKRIPHVMLFAAENIPPLQELTYHYNYMIDHVYDSAGNIKKKNCYCGSNECTGRLY